MGQVWICLIEGAVSCASMSHLPKPQSGGAFRRVRFALACRTEPLIMILRQIPAPEQGLLFLFFLWPQHFRIGPWPEPSLSEKNVEKNLRPTGGKLGVPQRP